MTAQKPSTCPVDIVATFCQLSDLFQNHESESRVASEVMKDSFAYSSACAAVLRDR
jgi:hypothetical protein